MTRTFATTTICCLWLLACAAPLAGQTFRMESDVYVGNEKKPFSQTLTLFIDGRAYDFILVDGQTREVSIFDIPRGRVIVLDPARSIKTTLTHRELLEATTKIKVETPSENEAFHFAANPQFEVAYSAADKVLTLRSDLMTYVVKGAAVEVTGADVVFQEFADWSARLNALRPGNLPPFARMELNRELAQRNLVPEEVTRTIVARTQLGQRRLEVVSRHPVNWTHSSKDQQRIARVTEQIGACKEVSFARYLEAQAAVAKTP